MSYIYKLQLPNIDILPDSKWKHKIDDINSAKTILQEYINRDGHIKVMTAFIEGEPRRQEWVDDLLRHFIPLYGEVTGADVTTKIVFTVFEDILGPPIEEYYSHFIRLNEIYSENNNWPEQVSDINAATEIIKKYIDKNGQIKFVESFEEKDGNLTIIMPEWQTDLMKHFQPLYGEQTGELVYQLMAIIFVNIFGAQPEELKYKGSFIRKDAQSIS